MNFKMIYILEYIEQKYARTSFVDNSIGQRGESQWKVRRGYIPCAARQARGKYDKT